MKHLRILILIPLTLLLTGSVTQQHLMVVARKNVAAPGGGGYDIEENFETATTGYENAWTEAAGAPAPATSTTGLSLEASQCLYITAEAGTEEAYISFTATDNVYVYFMMRIENAWTAQRRQWSLKNGTSTVSEMAARNAPMQWDIYDGTSGSDIGGYPSADTTYHVWYEYEKGTGANAQHRFYVATTTTKPTVECEITNGGSTAQVNRLSLGTWGAPAGDVYFDKIRVSFSDPIGSDPE